jgi:hypothetical protein
LGQTGGGITPTGEPAGGLMKCATPSADRLTTSTH